MVNREEQKKDEDQQQEKVYVQEVEISMRLLNDKLNHIISLLEK